MTAGTTYYEYYQLRAILEWELADRAPSLAGKDHHRLEAAKYELLAKSAKQGMIKPNMD